MEMESSPGLNVHPVFVTGACNSSTTCCVIARNYNTCSWKAASIHPHSSIQGISFQNDNKVDDESDDLVAFGVSPPAMLRQPPSEMSTTVRTFLRTGRLLGN